MRAAIILLAVLVSACSGTRDRDRFHITITRGAGSQPMVAPFDTSLMEWSKGEGPGYLMGTATLTREDGKVATCHEQAVLLLPHTPYMEELVGYLKMGTSGLLEPEYFDYRRGANCDQHGKFYFDKLPLGDYIVVTKVTWRVPEPKGRGFIRKGGVMAAPVTIANGPVNCRSEAGQPALCPTTVVMGPSNL